MGRCQEFIGVRCIEAANAQGEGQHLYNMHLTDTEIIRCCDCAYSRKGGGTGMLCYYFEDANSVPAFVTPDGFCAWAERDE